MFDSDNYVKRRGQKLPFDLLAVCQPGWYYVADIVMQLNQQGINFDYIVAELSRQLKELTPRVSPERTSEIFITGQTRGGRVEKRRLSFFPQVNGYWVSHFTVKRP